MGELVFIGLGLHDENDITLKGLDEAKRCDVLFTESYTSKLKEGAIQELEKKIGKEMIALGRSEVESGEIILHEAREKAVGFLVPGDAMSATTHIDLRLRAQKEGIKTKVVCGVSIVTAATGLLGLQSYKFGRTTTLPFKQKGYFPSSPYDAIKRNREMGLHTLVLLDLKESGETMSVAEALDYLMEKERSDKGMVLSNNDLVCALGDVSSDEPEVVCDSIMNLVKREMRSKIFCLVIPGDLHFMEEEALKIFAGSPESD
jgi:diphthine synthase